jgi:hypothetical protein
VAPGSNPSFWNDWTLKEAVIVEGIYKFYVNWSTVTFGKKDQRGSVDEGGPKFCKRKEEAVF